MRTQSTILYVGSYDLPPSSGSHAHFVLIRDLSLQSLTVDLLLPDSTRSLCNECTNRGFHRERPVSRLSGYHPTTPPFAHVKSKQHVFSFSFRLYPYAWQYSSNLHVMRIGYLNFPQTFDEGRYDGLYQGWAAGRSTRNVRSRPPNCHNKRELISCHTKVNSYTLT